MQILNRVKKVVLYRKTVVKLHLTFRVMNCGLLKLNMWLILMYICCFKEPVIDILCFFDNVFVSDQRGILTPKCF